MSRRKTQRKRTGQAVRDGQRSAVPGWIWVLLGVVMGLGLAVFLMIAGLMPRQRDGAPAPVPNPNAEATRADAEDLSQPEGEAEPEWQPSYDFYTVLPEMEVVIPDDEIQDRVERREENAASRGPYVLQVGSFRNHEDAERIKAELALLGIPAVVRTVTINESTWHRVRAGPYVSVREMDVDRRRLQENRFEVMVLTERG